jgi:chloramphenicol 3-O-phosphotransferase
MKRIILISGKLQSGKNQLAEFLKEEFAKKNLNVGQDLFAGPLKDWCKEDFRPLTELLASIAKDIKSVAQLSFDVPAKNTGISNESSLLNICKAVDDKLLVKD